MAELAMNDVLDSVSQAGMTEGFGDLSRKFEKMLRRMDEMVYLQRLAMLEPGSVLRFLAPDGQPIALSLPDAQDDFVQRIILRSRNFYEAPLLSLIKDKGLVSAASCVCDIGANIGNHSVYFGRILGAARVMAFEPQAYVHATLTRNIALNGLADRASAFNCMLGESAGNGRVARFSTRNLGATSFVADDSGDVPMCALDDVLPPEALDSLDLIKIDVEGMQDAVLRGAAGILHARKPALWVEILERDQTGQDTIDYLAGFGYRPELLGPKDFLFRV